jgi:GNAT superfamily N-acetyltransferase
MPDMLVKLYDLPPRDASLDHCKAMGITIRRPMPYEKSLVLDWIREQFAVGWADETDAAFARQPASCFIATEKGHVIGFATFDATARGFFGPTGVQASHRGRGVGKALLIASVHGLAELGFAYGIIGQAEETARIFYAKSVGATVIPDSDPSVYRDWLSRT